MSEDESEKVQPITKTLKIDKKYGKIVSVEVKRRDPFLPPSVEKRLRESLPKTKAITANNLAAKFEIKINIHNYCEPSGSPPQNSAFWNLGQGGGCALRANIVKTSPDPLPFLKKTKTGARDAHKLLNLLPQRQKKHPPLLKQ
jgi:hypothetical protein